MICERCHGTGSIERTVTRNGIAEWICPNCHGFGIWHCCDGDQEHAEEKEVTDNGDSLRINR